MANLSGITLDDTTFSVAANGGSAVMPIHVKLPKSASDSTSSGLSMLAWPDGKRYVYATTPNSEQVAYIPPEYMGVGEVYIREAVQILSAVTRAQASPQPLHNITTIVVYNSVIGDATLGATVSLSSLRSGTAGLTSWTIDPGSTHITFYVNPNASS